MRSIIATLALCVAVASAFTTQPNAFTTKSLAVGERASNVFAAAAHRSRRATIVMSGKANGRFYVYLVLADISYVRTALRDIETKCWKCMMKYV